MPTTSRRWLPWIAAALVGASACDTVPATPMSPKSTTPMALRMAISPPAPEILVLVVDDAPTASAAALRERIAAELRSWFEARRWARFAGCGTPDPAAIHPGDFRVMVVRPSAPLEERFVTWLDDPDLAWVTEVSGTAEIPPLSDAVSRALKSRTAEPGEAYLPLRATRHALALASRTAIPATETGEALLAAIPESANVELLLASTRDDEDDSPPKALLPGDAARASLSVTMLVGPFQPYDDSCWALPDGHTRLETWANASQELVWRTLTWPCDDPSGWDELLPVQGGDCVPYCTERTPVVFADGRPDCRVVVDSAVLDRCDPTRGHRDPEAGPTFVEDDEGRTLRRCEVVLLEGEALEGCRSSLECPGCGSGFCATEVPELRPDSWCGAGESAWPLRITGRVAAGFDGLLRMDCNTVRIE